MVDALTKEMFFDVDEKGLVPDEVRGQFFRKLRMRSENRTCFECTNRNPTWISLSYSVYLCLECSGEHRRKGVHISFVRSVELDRFSPEQMAQMAVGGNGKALEYFKQSGMGKTSDLGRPVEYSSKVAQKYKNLIEQMTAQICAKYGVGFKEPTKTAFANNLSPISAAAPDPRCFPPRLSMMSTLSLDPVDQSADFAFNTTEDSMTSRWSIGSGKHKAKPAPKAVVLPTSVKVDTESVTVPQPSTPTRASLIAANPVMLFGSRQQKAKAFDFDFDFDEVEAEANKPAPQPIQIVNSVESVSASITTARPSVSISTVVSDPAPVPPAPANTSGKAIFSYLNAATPAPSKSAQEAAMETTMDKFAGKKGISSDDFFQDQIGESAAARHERGNRYQELANAGAISSASFFGEEIPAGQDRRVSKGEVMAAGMAQAGSVAALLNSYINKART